MSEPGYDAVVFDFDGLILDTETSIYVAWREVYEAHGVPSLTLEEWAAEVGTARGLDLVGEIEARGGVIDAGILAGRRARRDELLAAEEVRPGVLEWLDAADRLGLGTAIASSSESAWVEEHLGRLGLRDRFGAVLCHSALIPPKPAPDLYLAACGALGAEPTRSVAVEDSPHGVAAAKRAGLGCVAVPNGVTAGLDFSMADLVVGSLAQLSLADALAELARLSRG